MGPPPVSSNGRTPDIKRGRSHSSGMGKPTMLAQIGGQKSANFIHRMFHGKDDKHAGGKDASSGLASPSVSEGGKGGRLSPSRKFSLSGKETDSRPSSIDIRRQQSTDSPPATPGSTYDSYMGSGVTSAAVSGPPSRATSVRDTSASRPHMTSGKYSSSSKPHASGDPNAIHPTALADKLAGISVNGGKAGKAGKAGNEHSPSGPLSPNLHGSEGTSAAPGGGTKFTFKDLVSSGPKLSRKASASSAASKSERGGSEKGGQDGTSTVSLLTKYGVCEKTAIGKGATAVVRLAHKWDRTSEKLYAVKVSGDPLCFLFPMGFVADLGYPFSFVRNSESDARTRRRKTTLRSSPRSSASRPPCTTPTWSKPSISSRTKVIIGVR